MDSDPAFGQRDGDPARPGSNVQDLPGCQGVAGEELDVWLSIEQVVQVGGLLVPAAMGHAAPRLSFQWALFYFGRRSAFRFGAVAVHPVGLDPNAHGEQNDEQRRLDQPAEIGGLDDQVGSDEGG